MQRHKVAFIASRICASVGCGFLSSIALAVMICPFWQKPHCGTCSSIQACCSGCSLPFVDKPFECGDFAFHGRDRRDAGADRRAVDDDRAGAALAESAAKARALQAEVVAEDVEQRRGRARCPVWNGRSPSVRSCSSVATMVAPRGGAADSSIQAGAWSLAFSSPRTERSTPPPARRGRMAGESRK